MAWFFLPQGSDAKVDVLVFSGLSVLYISMLEFSAWDTCVFLAYHLTVRCGAPSYNRLKKFQPMKTQFCNIYFWPGFFFK